MNVAVKTILIGQQRRQTLTFSIFSVVVLFLTSGILELLYLVDMSPNGPAWLILLGGAVLICAGTPAYHNNGIVPSVLMGIAPFAAHRAWYYRRLCGIPCPENVSIIPPYPIDMLELISPLLLIGFLGGRLIARTFPDER